MKELLITLSLSPEGLDRAKVLAALTGLTDVLTAMNACLNSSDARLALDVQALGTNAFELKVAVYPDTRLQIAAALSPATHCEICSAETIVRTLSELCDLMTWLDGRPGAGISTGELVQVTCEDETLTTTLECWKAYSKTTVRDALDRWVAELVDVEVKLTDLTGQILLSLTPDTVSHIGNKRAVLLGTTVSKKVLRLEKMKGTEWSVSFGEKTSFDVTVLDDAFLRALAAEDERIALGDYLLVDLEASQWFEGNRLRSTYRLLKVLKHSSQPDVLVA